MDNKRIGRYEIKEEIGRGGMATVYLAYDPRFKRSVAIKVLPRQFTHDPTFRGRFEREAQTIAVLEHPAIVPVYDYGEDDEQPYLVMRYMAGGSLTDRIIKGPMPVAETVKVIQRIASALDEVHAKGIIHRDLKPDNFLFDQRNVAYVSDFGIVKLAESTATYTSDGLIGTPAYMSPEQARGNAKLDGRSDVYTLGIILFQMLTGQLPYQSDTPIGQALMHISEPIPVILTTNPNLPLGFEVVMTTALAKDRNRRYKTAGQLAAAAAAAARGEMPRAYLPSAKVRSSAITEVLPRPQAPVQVQSQTNHVSASVQPRKSPTWMWGIATILVLSLLVLGGQKMFNGGVFGREGGNDGGTAVTQSAPAPTITPQPTLIQVDMQEMAGTAVAAAQATLIAAYTPTPLPTIPPTLLPNQIGILAQNDETRPFTLADPIEVNTTMAELYLNNDRSVILQDAYIAAQPNTQIEFENITADPAAAAGVSLLLFEGSNIFLSTGGYAKGVDLSPIEDSRISFLATNSCLSVQYGQEGEILVGCYQGNCHYRANEREEVTPLAEGNLLRYDVRKQQVVETRPIRSSESYYFAQILRQTNAGQAIYTQCISPLFPPTRVPLPTPTKEPAPIPTNTPAPSNNNSPSPAKPPTNTPLPSNPPTNTPNPATDTPMPATNTPRPTITPTYTIHPTITAQPPTDTPEPTIHPTVTPQLPTNTPIPFETISIPTKVLNTATPPRDGFETPILE